MRRTATTASTKRALPVSLAFFASQSSIFPTLSILNAVILQSSICFSPIIQTKVSGRVYLEDHSNEEALNAASTSSSCVRVLFVVLSPASKQSSQASSANL